MPKETKKIKSKLYKPKIENEKDFYNAINRALKTTDHRDALLSIIKEFEGYKKFMSENLIASSVPSDKILMFRFIYQLKEKVWKDIEIYGDQSLERLAEYIIDEMGWDNDHLHAFFFPEKRNGGIWEWYTSYEIGSAGVDNDQFPILHTDEVLVLSIDYSKHPRLGFVFDFGDDHRFVMEYKGLRDADKNEKKDNFPKVVDQRGVAPEQYPDYVD
ncbi:MAG: hypothetical protein A3D99_00900 [Candidatus Andersenbacteria bacterium RIFCSPHIGHO2_12_FULL_45_11]|uniref:Plasmid pRiA4b Orf3-like domain-containing protein n=1 Tax=Candidatus Andersenbacteria bacterium RIFCSPHIGHO2_12_FULL_45_11 TaxID=1797281 RepID=A0A1G1X5F2_9BACT|nr:MAG: hypothetical protein A3D99_00900 [Candidatus Andersenbacteria bacterium RIFCSPHIGHO2_12_FULL_45_11]